MIGHGKSPVGKGWGTKIDACDYVVRMWDWFSFQTPEDYGTKYDYGLFEAHPSMMETFHMYEKPSPAVAWVASVLGFPERCNLPEGTALVYQSEWNEIGKGLGGLGASGKLQFTRGTIVACWAITNAEPGDTIILVGFDNVHKGVALSIEEGFPEAYVNAPTTFSFIGYKPGRKYGNHDFGIETPVMLRLARDRGVHLKFSNDLWE